MSAFRVGQRVKKVRGRHNIGLTGTVVAVRGDVIDVLTDKPCTFYPGIVDMSMPAGVVGATDPAYWEPITDAPLYADILTMERLPQGPIRDPSLTPEPVAG